VIAGAAHVLSHTLRQHLDSRCHLAYDSRPASRIWRPRPG